MLKFFTYATLTSILVGAGIALEMHPSTHPTDAPIARISAPLSANADFANAGVQVSNADLARPDLAHPDLAHPDQLNLHPSDLGLSSRLLPPPPAAPWATGEADAALDTVAAPIVPRGSISTPLPRSIPDALDSGDSFDRAPFEPAPLPFRASFPASALVSQDPALVPWDRPSIAPRSPRAPVPHAPSRPPVPAPTPAPFPVPTAQSTPAFPLASVNKPLPVQLSSEAASSRFLPPPPPSEFNPEQPPVPALW